VETPGFHFIHRHKRTQVVARFALHHLPPPLVLMAPLKQKHPNLGPYGRKIATEPTLCSANTHCLSTLSSPFLQPAVRFGSRYCLYIELLY